MQTIAIVTTRTAPTRLWQLDKTRKIQNRKIISSSRASSWRARCSSICRLAHHPPTNKQQQQKPPPPHFIKKKSKKMKRIGIIWLLLDFTQPDVEHLDSNDIGQPTAWQTSSSSSTATTSSISSTWALIVLLLLLSTCCVVQSSHWISLFNPSFCSPPFSLPFLSTRVPAGLASVRSLLSFCILFLCVLLYECLKWLIDYVPTKKQVESQSQ